MPGRALPSGGFMWKKILPVFVFCAIVFGLAGAGIFSEEKAYSATEKRELQTRPKPKAKTIKKGKFQKKYERYLSDQFPGRDGWVRLQTGISRLLGKTESNGVYFGTDDYLLEHYDGKDFEPEQVKQNIDALRKFVLRAKKQAQVRAMIVPTKTWEMKYHLPAFAPTYDEQIFYDALYEAFDGNEELLVPVERELVLRSAGDAPQTYYRTDHHWTTEGARIGYEAYLKSLSEDGAAARAAEKSDLTCVCDDFLGTTYAKVHQAGRADEICIYEPKKKLSVVYNMGERTTDTLFEMEYLEKEDKYSVFTGGNQAVIEITGGEKNGRTLLLIKDSFANCMVPFLAEDYEKVVVVDLRQLNVGCVTLLEMFAPTDVLILYNSAQFADDIEFAIKCNS